MTTKRITRWGIVLFLLAALALLTGALSQPTMAEGGEPERRVPLQTTDILLRPGVYETAGGRYAVVRLGRDLTRAEHDALAARGVRLLSYLGDGTYIAGVDPGALTSDLTLAYGIEAAAPWATGNKAAPGLRSGEVEDWAMTEGGLLKVVVLFFADVSPEEMEAILSRHAKDYQVERPPLLWAVEIDQSGLDGLLTEQGIHAVEPGPIPPQPLLNDVRARIHANEVQQAVITTSPPTIQYNGLTGEGVVLQVSEAVWDGHPDFLKPNGASRFVNPSPDYGCGYDCWHGTHVAGIIGGGGVHSILMQNTPWFAPIGTWRGIAPEATLYDGQYNGSTPLIDASNHSYTMEIQYDSEASGWDGQVRGDSGRARQWTVVWAAGNQGFNGGNYGEEEGYYSMQPSAKNVIAVGSATTNDGSLSYFSSLGPTYDGRIKPDVMAPGSKGGLPANFDIDTDVISVDIDYIRIIDTRTGTIDAAWEFNQDGDQEGWFEVDYWQIFNTRTSGGYLSFDAGQKMYNCDVCGLYPFGINFDVNLPTHPYQTIEMRFKLSTSKGIATGVSGFQWPGYINDSVQHYFPATANGAWNVQSIPVGRWGDKWAGRTLDELHLIPFWGLGPQIVSDYKHPSEVDYGYIVTNGTSMAAPAATGSVGLILQQMHEELGIDLTANQPYPSTLKAILVQTADDMIHATSDPRDPDNPDTGAPVLYYPGPDFATGYGLINVKAAVDLVAADPGTAAAARLIREGSLDARQKAIYEMNLTAADITRLGGNLKFTLAWDDAPGDTTTPETAPKLVNDLDLYLIGPDGTIYLPWTLDPLPVTDCGGSGPGCGDPDPISPWDVVPAQKAADHRNNVEMVQVSGATAGRWQIVVNAYRMPMPLQKYSVVGNVPITLTDGSVYESEPNNVLSNADQIYYGDVMGGKINGAGDVDTFVFDAGSWYSNILIDIDAAAIGSPMNSTVCLLDQSGNNVACNEDTDTSDSLLFRNLENGRYYIQVTQAGNNAGGNAYNYKLILSSPLLVSATATGTVAGIPFQPADILAHSDLNNGEQKWLLFFDGSDVGITKNVTNIASEVSTGNILIGLSANQTVPGVGATTPWDILVFNATRYGPATAGAFSMGLPGRQHSLTTTAEKIDALEDGSLGSGPTSSFWMSTAGTAVIPYYLGTLKPKDEDIFYWDGANEEWNSLFAGKQVTGLAVEDISAMSFNDPANKFYLTILGNGIISGNKVTQKDIFAINFPGYTWGGYVWRGPQHGWNFNIDGFEYDPN